MNKLLAVISAPVETMSGYGARARDFVKAICELKKDEWEIQVLSQRWGSTPWTGMQEDTEENRMLRGLINRSGQLPRQPDVWIQITVPNEFQPIGKFNIGVTAGIETTVCDVEFINGCNRMDLTLVSSQHAKNVLVNTKYEEKDPAGNLIRNIKIEKPIEVLFEGVDLNKYFYIAPETKNHSDLIADLDEIEEDFCFLYVGHWLQGDLGEDRKNTGLLIKLFLETFKDSEKKQPALILKTSYGTSSIVDREQVLRNIDIIRNSITGYYAPKATVPNIYLLHGDFEDQDINDLYNHPKVKAFITLTKGEGFGRPLAEFCLSKKPMIATNWSGHLDFLSSEYSVLLPGVLTPCHPSAFSKGLIIEGASWFSVDETAVKDTLVDVYTNYGKYEVMGKRQGHRIKTQFNYENMVFLLGTFLQQYVPQASPIPQIQKIKLPKLLKIS